MAPGRPLLEVKGVGQDFPVPERENEVVSILKNITFTAENPETICLLGPSGCGKSTLMRMISGMYDRYVKMPTTGEVRIRGKLVQGPHEDVLTVFQKPVLKAWLNVEQNVLLPFKSALWGKKVPPEERRARAAAMIKAVGLDHAVKLYPRQLSGGMQQRVALAARLVLHPPLLCLDEPFSALDPQTRLEMQQLAISLWQQYPCLAIFVTHDVTEALRLADRIIVLSTRPGTIVIDSSITAPKPRAAAWLQSAEARTLEAEIISRIRDAKATTGHGTLKLEV
jgi:ABC-type nitrate/sulfonate/bicarbonate transport system ATPase subunit